MGLAGAKKCRGKGSPGITRHDASHCRGGRRTIDGQISVTSGSLEGSHPWGGGLRTAKGEEAPLPLGGELELAPPAFRLAVTDGPEWCPLPGPQKGLPNLPPVFETDTHCLSHKQLGGGNSVRKDTE